MLDHLEPAVLNYDGSVLPAPILVINRKLRVKKYMAKGSITTSDFVSFVYVHYFTIQSRKFNTLATNIKQIPFVYDWFNILQKRQEIDFCRDRFKLAEYIDLWEHISPDEFQAILYTHRKDLRGQGDLCEWTTNSRRNSHLIKMDLTLIFEKLSLFDNQLDEDTSKPYPDVINWSLLPDALSPSHGSLNPSRTTSKIHQINNVIRIARRILKDGDVVVDFCGGGGHLSLVVAYLFPNVTVYLVDRNSVSLAISRQRKKTLGLNNFIIEQADIFEWKSSPFQLGLAIHACGPLTDMVMEKCIAQNASYILIPCCFGSIKNSVLDVVSFPRSQAFRNVGISIDEYTTLSSAADVAVGKKRDRGRKAMYLIDVDRNEYAKEKGYLTHEFTLRPDDCTPKNHVIVGITGHPSTLESLSHTFFETKNEDLTMST